MQDKKILAIFDFDDTLFNGQSHSYFLSYLESTLPLHRRVLLKVKKRLVRSVQNDREQKEFILSAFKGLSVDTFEKHTHDFFSKVVLNRLNKSVCTLLKEHQSKGHTIVIASGGFEPYLKFIRGYFGFEDLICTQLKFEDGIFTGKIEGDECLGKHKALLVNAQFGAENIDWNNSYVYSDHKSDIPLFNLAGNKIVIDFGQPLDWVSSGFTKITV